ncbi:hypothetical protein [Desulfosporosinus sp. Sb-LF]|uniref:LptM family lipoprotein n=1 Tax=Desulfosporosinus sp. Sb-LF TaxID=2560027 RepID=UPI00107F0B0A|nr:hypothetical protein [Desulfosporosinus sp. Sb-LF]TGE33123.1 hypothetical protein E4K68_09875 [Desulfosporosinus sp. Sb-LF]
MRKIIVLTAIMSLALLLAGCGNGTIAPKSNQPSTKTTQQAGNATGQPSNAKDSSTKTGAEIVAKSENIMSSSDKEELLNQVNKELDSLFSNINNLEDAQDADLELNQK